MKNNKLSEFEQKKSKTKVNAFLITSTEPDFRFFFNRTTHGHEGNKKKIRFGHLRRHHSYVEWRE